MFRLASPLRRLAAGVFLPCAFSVQAEVSPEAILGKVYSGFMKKNACWIAQTTDTPQKYCVTIDRVDRMVVEGVPRTYILTSGRAIDDKGEDNGGHVTPGLIGAFVIEERGGNAQIVAGDAQITLGAFGRGPAKWRFVKLGPSDYWGWLNTAGDCHQGYCGSDYVILAPYGKGIRDIAAFPSAGDNSGACGDKQCEARAIQLSSKLEIDSSRIDAKVFPLIVTVSGKMGGQTLAPKPWAIPFDEKKWKYVAPKNWPLKNAEF